MTRRHSETMARPRRPAHRMKLRVTDTAGEELHQNLLPAKNQGSRPYPPLKVFWAQPGSPLGLWFSLFCLLITRSKGGSSKTATEICFPSLSAALGGTDTPLTPAFSIARATSPEAFTSSMNPFDTFGSSGAAFSNTEGLFNAHEPCRRAPVIREASSRWQRDAHAGEDIHLYREDQFERPVRIRCADQFSMLNAATQKRIVNAVQRDSMRTPFRSTSSMARTGDPAGTR